MNKIVIGVVVAVLVVAGVGSTVYFLNMDDEATTNSSQSAPTSTQTTETGTETTAQESESTSSSVEIANFAFSPASITVKKGATVTWTNKDSAVHTATSDNDAPVAFDSGNLATGESFSFTFDEVGTYAYHCTPHPSMTASVTVTE